MTWAYYMSPMMYGQTAIVMNEFLDERWSSVRFHQVLLLLTSLYQL